MGAKILREEYNLLGWLEGLSGFFLIVVLSSSTLSVFGL